ncbi:MAG: uroporphyrinogen-III synthase [Kiloniellaceae bacterium]
MRVLVTRPEKDAQALAAALAARGHEVVVEPMLTVAPAEGVETQLDLAGVQALLFTSANGARAFARLCEQRALPVFAVGEASAAAARAAGFAEVENAGGDVNDLARLVVERLSPEDGALFHGAGSKLAGDLQGTLEAAGFTVRRVTLYEARPAAALSDGLRAALAEGRLDAATFYSPRTAETFVRLVEKADLGAACARLAAVCLSEAVADKARALSWREVRVAGRPDREALLACIDDMAAAASAAVAESAMPADPTPEPTSAGARPPDAAKEAAHGIIAKFGGIRPMASKLGVAVSTVQGWRERGSIPAARHGQILAAAEAHGIALDRAELTESERSPEARAPHAEAAAEAPAREQAVPAPAEAEKAAEAPRPAAPTAPPAAAGAWWRGFAAGALVLALGAGAAVLARDLWLPYLAPPPPEAAEDLAAGRLADLEDRLSAIEAAPDLDETRAAVDRLQGGLAALNARVDALAARGPPAQGPDQRLEALSGLEDRSARLDREVAGLKARLDALAAQAPPAEGPDQRLEALSGLEARIAGLDREVAGLMARLDDLAGLRERGDARDRDIADLRAKIEALGAARAEAAAGPAGEAALALTVLRLRDALRGAGPFAAEYEALRALAEAAPAAEAAGLAEAIAPLEPYAASGVPGLVALKTEFPAAARAILAQARGGSGDDWVAAVLRRLAGLVTVRPVGPVEGEDAAAVVARAEAYLAADDLASAVRELDALSGRAAEAARPWRAKAEARLTAERTLARLARLLVARPVPADG